MRTTFHLFIVLIVALAASSFASIFGKKKQYRDRICFNNRAQNAILSKTSGDLGSAIARHNLFAMFQNK